LVKTQKEALNTMLGGFMRKEPLNSRKLYEHPEVVALFTRENCISFFDRIQGYDEEVNEEFLMSLIPHSKRHATVNFMGLTLELTPNFISRITVSHWGSLGAKRRNHWDKLLRRHFFCLRSIL